MKIAVFVDEFPLTSQTFVSNQVLGLWQAGMDVTVLALHAPVGGISTQALPQGFPAEKVIYLTQAEPQSAVQKLLSRSCKLLRCIFSKSAARALKSLSPRFGNQGKSLLLSSIIVQVKRPLAFDVVLCHFGHNGILAHKLHQLGGLDGKIATIFHGYDISAKPALDKYLSDYKKLFVEGDLLLPISNLWRDKLIEHGAPAYKIKVHRMGVDLSLFTYRDTFESDAGATQENEHYRLFTVARFSEKKGLEHAICALASLPERLEYTYYLAGFGELENELKELVKAKGLANSVRFLGKLSSAQVKEQMQLADAFIQPSITARDGDMEGVPVAIMEAMATGVPVVSTYHSGIPELIEHQVSGMLSPERDEKALAENIYQLCKDVGLQKTIASNARTKIEQVADVRKLNEQLISTFQDLLDSPS
ncbi:glycosyltransferase [Thalassotalea euphylliae]|uniref:Glycosyltransferase n=1 Tax=Thalassotalea euphylliae TaxID=1655234 RepID=A0A3E0TQ79_9GAMM|nr:glycosyltransferase [Thalassotalea euphylliae]REL26115.1 glycosyltransferase [Thalassotalea euphylliae]